MSIFSDPRITVMLSKSEIETRIATLGEEITRAYKDDSAELVLVVEDIVDTGLTMRYLLENLATRNPKSVRLCALLEKPTKNTSGVVVDYLGFTIPDKFVIGYGLDYGEKYRNLPFVGVFEQSK